MTHLCHAIGCTTEVVPERLMCFKHWRLVPENIRREVIAHYRDSDVQSREWLKAARAAIHAVTERERAS